MKLWPRLAGALSASLLIALLQADTALAQEDTSSVSVLSDILTPILVIIDKILDYWVNSVTGNTLTSPWGEGLVQSLATLVQQMTTFFAQFSLLFPSSNGG